MKKSLVYTRTGDQGQTALIGGVRVSKADDRVEAYGTVDELNSNIGLMIALDVPEYEALLISIQRNLFGIGSIFAASDPHSPTLKKITENDIQELEKAIDELESSLPQLHHFILPGGSVVAAHCHVARTVCRRAERCAVRLSQTHEIPEIALRYLNRLSDFLFVLARTFNHKKQIKENII